MNRMAFLAALVLIWPTASGAAAPRSAARPESRGLEKASPSLIEAGDSHMQSLEALEAALVAFDAGDWSLAARGFERALALDPKNGEAAMMAGVAWHRAGDDGRASANLSRALAAPLSARDRTLVEGLSAEIASAARPAEDAPATSSEPSQKSFGYVLLGVGAGFDSNPSQTGLGAFENVDFSRWSRGLAQGGASGTVSFSAGHGLRLGRVVESEISYSLYQLAYSDVRFDDYSIQDHTVDLSVRARFAGRWRPALSVRGNYALTGLALGLKPFVRALAAEPSLTLVENGTFSTRLTATATRNQILDPRYAFLDGHRLDVALAQFVRPAGWLITVSVRHRRENVGTRREELDWFDESCTDPEDCRFRSVIPSSYVANGAAARVSSPFGRWFRVGASARAELRDYADDAVTRGLSTDARGRERRLHRIDQRFVAGVELRFGRELGVVLRYDVLVNRSTIDGSGADTCSPCSPLDFENRSFVKHMAALEVEGSWWSL